MNQISRGHLPKAGDRAREACASRPILVSRIKLARFGLIATWLIFAGVLLAGEAGTFGNAPAPVSTALVEKGSYSSPIRITGTAEARAETTLASTIAGYVEQLYVDEGDVVKKGQPVAQLRPKAYEYACQQARSTYLSDKAEWEELRAGTRSEDIAIAKANLDAAVKLEEIAQADYDRNLSLKDSNVISRDRYDVARERLEQAVADRAVKKAIYERALAGPRPEEVTAAEAKTSSSLAAALYAEDELSRTTIRAPFAGVITEKRTEVGSWVKIGDGLFDLENNEIIQVRANLPENRYNRVSVGQDLTISFDSVPDRKFTGNVTSKIPRGIGRSRTFPMIIELHNNEKLLASGMLARILLVGSESAGASVVIPRDALVPRGAEEVVFRVVQRDGKDVAERVEVRKGRYFGEAVEVFGELRAGDRVVIRGNERLQPDQPVVVDQFLTRQSASLDPPPTPMKESSDSP